jgi:hypothetical protein
LEAVREEKKTAVCLKHQLTRTWSDLSIEENFAANDLTSLIDERSHICDMIIVSRVIFL